jgi:hypothetical protein
MITIKIKVDSLNFYWAEHGMLWPNGTPIKCVWEDLYYNIFRDGLELRSGSTTVESKDYVINEIKETNGDIGQKMELEYPGYIEEELNSTNYGIPLKDLPNTQERLWSFSYSENEPGEKDFFQIEDMINLPKDERGVNPSYITGFDPAPVLNKNVISEWIKAYITKFLGYTEEMNVEWVEEPTLEHLKKELAEDYENALEWEKNKKDGIKTKIVLLPQPLRYFMDDKEVDKLEERGLVHAEMIEDSNAFLFHFKDGHTELSGTQVNLEDHLNG